MGSEGDMKKPTELQRLSDPNFIVEIAYGPPLASLVAQTPGSGIVVGGQYCEQETRFVWKKAHLSEDDNRIFDAEGRLMCCSHHYGKNPYDALDGPLDLVPDDPMGEWESICYISGYQGMPDLKVRPKGFSAHGRQRILDTTGDTTLCNIAKLSRMKSKSIRHNLAVFSGDEEHEPTYQVLVDLVGRTMQLVNQQEERVAVFTKSEKTLLLNAAFGIGSEFTIDVAPGVDWTAILAICIGLHQVGKHYAKDAFNNFLVEPVKGQAMNMAFDEATAAYEEVEGEEEEPEGEEAEGEEAEVEEEVDEAEGEEAEVEEEVEEDEEGGTLGQIFEIISSIFEE